MNASPLSWPWYPPSIALCALLLVLLQPTQAQAAFRRSVTAATPVSSATLAPPAGTPLVSNTNCGLVILDTPRLTISWTPTPSTFATGYLVTPYLGATALTPVAISGRATTTTLVTVTRTMTYTFKVQATYANWTSAAVTTASAYCPLLYL